MVNILPKLNFGRDIVVEIGRTIVTSNQAPQPLGTYSLGITATPRKLLYVAGQVGMDASGSHVRKGDAAAQTRQALKNIGHVLAAAGGDLTLVT